jgi:hypothetical protein
LCSNVLKDEISESCMERYLSRKPACCELGAMRMQWVHCTIIELDLLVILGGPPGTPREHCRLSFDLLCTKSRSQSRWGYKRSGQYLCRAPFLREDVMDIVSFFVTNRGQPFLLFRRSLWRLCRCYAQTNPRAASYFSTAEHMCDGSATRATSFSPIVVVNQTAVGHWDLPLVGRLEFFVYACLRRGGDAIAEARVAGEGMQLVSHISAKNQGHSCADSPRRVMENTQLRNSIRIKAVACLAQ